MNRLTGLALAAVIAILLATPAIAQKQPSKDEWFQQIAKLTNTKKPEDATKAYQMSKDFLAQYGKDTDDKVKKIRDFVVKFRLNEFNRALDDVRIDDAIEFGNDILADEPNNAYVTMNLAYGGYEAFTKKQDKGFASKSIDYARRTLEFLEAGNVPKDIKPFKDQAEVTAMMNYVIATFSIEFDLKEAAIRFYRAVQPESQIKKSSYPFFIISQYYERKYESMAADFQKNHGSKRAEDEAMKTDRATIDQTISRMIDAYARAVKLGEAENNPELASWKQRLTQVYTFRKGDAKGLDEMIAGILATPMSEPN
jgi:hypothetical protein